MFHVMIFTVCLSFRLSNGAGMTSWTLLYPLETMRSRITAGVIPAGIPLPAVLSGIVAKVRRMVMVTKRAKRVCPMHPLDGTVR